MGAIKSSVVVFLGAGLGAVCRFWIGSNIQARYGQGFPYGTLAVNLTGCFLIGIVMTLLVRWGASEQLRLLIIVGLLGGYTTFSSFGSETLLLLREGAVGKALAYVGVSNGAGVLLCWLGSKLSELVPK